MNQAHCSRCRVRVRHVCQNSEFLSTHDECTRAVAPRVDVMCEKLYVPHFILTPIIFVHSDIQSDW